MGTKRYNKKRKQTKKRKQRGGMFGFLNKLNLFAMTQAKADIQKKACEAKCDVTYRKNMATVDKGNTSAEVKAPEKPAALGMPPPEKAPDKALGDPIEKPRPPEEDKEEPKPPGAAPPGDEPKPLGGQPKPPSGEPPGGAFGGRSKKRKKRKGKKSKKKQNGGKGKKKKRKGGCGCSN